MSLFDNLFDETGTPRALTEQEAFAGILLAGSAADGHIAQSEAQSLFATAARMRLFQGVSPGQWTAMIDELLKILKKSGPLKLVDVCAAALPEGVRQTAFANACDIVLADGIVESEEKGFLDHLQKALALDGDTALSIIEVMIIKNKG